MRIMSLTLPEATRVPSGDHATLSTLVVYPSSTSSSWPDWAFQMRTVASKLPEAMRVPSGDQATLSTESVCSSSTSSSWPD